MLQTQQGSGAFFDLRLPTGVRLVGMAPDEAAAKRLMAEIEECGTAPKSTNPLTCNCGEKIDFNPRTLHWFHVETLLLRCEIERELPRALPTAPKSREREFLRGVWGLTAPNVSGA